jgi:NAD(P)-dependent dehydrogenase (short-subunit alcohol dehydrogenase family)
LKLLAETLYFRLVQAALPHLRRGASIIVTGSETGFEGPEMLPDYSATKGAIHTMIKSLAKMLAERGIDLSALNLLRRVKQVKGDSNG